MKSGSNFLCQSTFFLFSKYSICVDKWSTFQVYFLRARCLLLLKVKKLFKVVHLLKIVVLLKCTKVVDMF